MTTSERTAFRFSIRLYGRLLCIYPRGFREEFRDSLVQVFGDLAGRALQRGGILLLTLLWMRVFRDLVTTAIREHFNVPVWACPPHIRLRWVLACSVGIGVGAVAADQFLWWSQSYAPAGHSIIVMLAAGFVQSAWAFRRSARDVLRWMAATAIGIVFFALPFRVLILGKSLQDTQVPLEEQLALALLQGVGVGLFQYLMLPKTGSRPWLWIPASAIGFAGAFGTVLVYLAAVPGVWRSVLNDVNLASFVAAAVYGLVTSLPLQSILNSTRSGMMVSSR